MHGRRKLKGIAGTCVSAKIRYRTRKAAEEALAKAMKTPDPRRGENRVYECDRCGHGYHLASKPEFGS